jgi:hypothetical protein
VSAIVSCLDFLDVAGNAWTALGPVDSKGFRF